MSLALLGTGIAAVGFSGAADQAAPGKSRGGGARRPRIITRAEIRMADEIDLARDTGEAQSNPMTFAGP